MKQDGSNIPMMRSLKLSTNNFLRGKRRSPIGGAIASSNNFEQCLRRQATHPLRYLADSAR
ncbi:MAG: hypothetical protein PUP90_13825 [Nostoc sp. S4]|nr:hypothetical protein [Nostoc sp. S4]